jgi:hypothetical protein
VAVSGADAQMAPRECGDDEAQRPGIADGVLRALPQLAIAGLKDGGKALLIAGTADPLLRCRRRSPSNHRVREWSKSPARITSPHYQPSVA